MKPYARWLKALQAGDFTDNVIPFEYSLDARGARFNLLVFDESQAEVEQAKSYLYAHRDVVGIAVERFEDA